MTKTTKTTMIETRTPTTSELIASALALIIRSDNRMSSEMAQYALGQEDFEITVSALSLIARSDDHYASGLAKAALEITGQ